MPQAVGERKGGSKTPLSAIIGLVYLDQRPVEPAALAGVIARLAHRGPDGQGLWRDGSVGLGHLLLRTTPEARHETLPLVDPARGLALTADARLDNRDELIGQLGLGARPAAEVSDSALLLRAYAEWGERCPERLLGDFAFALWDARRQRLFCARDPAGARGSFYIHTPRLFACATELKALLALPEVRRRLNETRVADYLLSRLEDPASTFYRDIVRLPAAHSLTVSREGLRLRRYWVLDPRRELRYGSNAEYAEAFRAVFSEAVRCRLRSAVPVGSTLSGGLDSSSIACTARDLLVAADGPPLRTFSAVFDSLPQVDERPHIRAVLARGGFAPHYVHADRLSPLADWERLCWHEDEAFYAPNLFMHWGLYQAAQQQGVRGLFDGLDGDTTVSHGLRRLAELAGQGRLLRLLGEAGTFRTFYGRPSWRLAAGVLWRHGLYPWLPAPLLRWRRALRGPTPPLWRAINPTIAPAFARRVQLDTYWQHWQPRTARSARQGHGQRLSRGIMAFTLEIADRAAAAFQIELRYPFYDRRLIEFCLALPADQKLDDGWSRVVMRRALAGSLPPKVAWRRGKSNLSPNFTRGLLIHERARIEAVIDDDQSPVWAYVDRAALRTVFQRYIARRAEPEAMIVWKAITLALWLSQVDLPSVLGSEGIALSTSARRRSPSHNRESMAGGLDGAAREPK